MAQLASTASAASAVTAASSPQQQQQQHVLKCPDCEFVCLSNNQMCRHIYLTCHTLVTCSQCPTRLVCWGFAPGVKKLFDKGRKDSVLLEDIRLDTAEKHFDSTQHQNMKVPPKDSFILSGPPEMYGLHPAPPKPDPLADPTAVRFRCPDCANVISTWTQMTRHLDATKHSLARCAECGLSLKCYGPGQPQRHEKMTGHRGILGIFRQKADYSTVAIPHRANSSKQYRCFCGVSFLHPLHLAEHMLHVHKWEPTGDCTCQECGTEGSVSSMLQHMSQHDAHVEFDVPGLDDDDYLVRVPPMTTEFGTVIADPGATGGDDLAVASSGVPSNSAATSSSSSSYRILYQCPDCWYIFSSWVRLEEHLIKTKHGLSFCIDCRRFLRPRLREDHTTITGHRNIVKEHMQHRDYEVFVNIDDPEMRKNIDSPNANTPSMGEDRLVYQCPVPNCRAVFLSYARLEEHVSNTRHGSVTCRECLTEFSILDGRALAEHPHPLDIPEYMKGVTCDDDLLVAVTDRELLQHFSHEYEECTACHKAVVRGSLTRHCLSAVCTAAQAPLDTAVWGEGSTSQPSSTHGSFNNNVAPVQLPQYNTVSAATVVDNGQMHAAPQYHLAPPGSLQQALFAAPQITHASMPWQGAPGSMGTTSQTVYLVPQPPPPPPPPQAQPMQQFVWHHPPS